MNGARVSRLLAILGLAAGSVHGLGAAREAIESVLQLPERYLVLAELRMLERLHLAEAALAPESRIAAEQWLAERMEVAPPRQAGCDPWNTPYRFANPTGATLATLPGPRARYFLESAGPDRRFGTVDDVRLAPDAGEGTTRISVEEVLATDRRARLLGDSALAGRWADSATAAIHGLGSNLTETEAAAVAAEVAAAWQEATRQLAEANSRAASPARRRYDPLARIRALAEWDGG